MNQRKKRVFNIKTFKFNLINRNLNVQQKQVMNVLLLSFLLFLFDGLWNIYVGLMPHIQFHPINVWMLHSLVEVKQKKIQNFFLPSLKWTMYNELTRKCL